MSLLDKFKNAGGQKPKVAADATTLASHKVTGKADLLAKFRTLGSTPLVELPPSEVLDQIPELQGADLATPTGGRVEKHELTYELANEQQRKVIDYALRGESVVLIGSAGTGKTATQGLLTRSLAQSGKVYPNSHLKDHKYIANGALNILICTYMNKAANNMRSAVAPEFKQNVLTIHKILEFQPVEEEVEDIDPDTGETFKRNRKIFRPMRHAMNPIRGIRTIVVEEASTIGLDLWEQFLDALPNRGADISWIFLGDLKQLPPVFGQSVLAQKLQELPVVELTQVYRQALDSPIKSFAISINEGKPFADQELHDKFAKPGELEFFNFSGKRANGTFIPRKQPQDLVHGLSDYFAKLLDSGDFVPFRDVILCPFRVNRTESKNYGGLNCDYLNTLIANKAGKARNAEVFEIQAGMTRKYLAVDDPIYFEKQEYTIVAIRKNPAYKGSPTKMESVYLDREGNYTNPEFADMDFDLKVSDILSMKVDTKDIDEDATVKAASHIITVQSFSSDPEDVRTIELGTSGAIANIDFAYATTVHKSIGSEWDKVWCIFHHAMVSMMSRELLYTACTRAKHYLGIFYDGQDWSNLRKINSSMLSHAIVNPEIKGVTLEEKLQWLKAQKAKAEEFAQGTANLLAAFKR